MYYAIRSQDNCVLDQRTLQGSTFTLRSHKMIASNGRLTTNALVFSDDKCIPCRVNDHCFSSSVIKMKCRKAGNVVASYSEFRENPFCWIHRICSPIGEISEETCRDMVRKKIARLFKINCEQFNIHSGIKCRFSMS